MNNTSKKVLEAIKRGGVRPRRSFVFAMRHIGLWFLWTMTVLVGAFTVGAFLFKIANSGIEHLHLVDLPPFRFVVSVFPFLWAALIAASAAAAHRQFRSTERGHTIPLRRVALLHGALTIGIGIALFLSGFGYIGESAALRLRGSSVERSYLKRWHSPENGLLAGRLHIIDGDTASLTGIDGGGYLVDISGLGAARVPVNIPVRVLGTAVDDGRFYACRVLPIRFRGAFGRNETALRQTDEIIVGDERTTLCGDLFPEY